MDFTPDEYEIYSKCPEAMSVGKLNAVVRALREALYHERLDRHERMKSFRGYGDDDDLA